MKNSVCVGIAVVLGLFPLESAAAGGAPADTDIILDDAAMTLDSASDSLPPIEKMPELKSFVKAEYPLEHLRRGDEATVGMDLLVSDSGTVDSAAVVQGAAPAFDSAAVAAARRFRFTPAMAQGAPVPVLLRYEYRFTVQDAVDSLAFSDSINFSGRIIEMGTRAPVADAMVVLMLSDTARDSLLPIPFSRYIRKIGSLAGQYLEENRLVTISDSTGRFAFRGLPSCSLGVSVVLTGYMPFEEKESIRRNEQTDVTYRLERQSYSDYEVVVYVKQPKKEVARRSLTLSEVRKVPGFGGDAVKVIQAMPGVARPLFGGGEIIVRGAGSGDNMYFLDGIQIPYVYHFGGLKSNYNSSALSTVDFYPGGFGVRYGGAVGAVIEIKGRRPKADRWHGFADVNLFDASFLYEMPLTPKLSFLLTARRSYIANVVEFFVNDILKQNLPFTVVPFYWDYVLRGDYQPLKNQHFYATLFGTKDKLELIASQVRGGSVSISSNLGKLSSENKFYFQSLGWDWDITPVWHNEFRYGLVRYSQNTEAFGVFTFDGATWAHAVRDQATWSPDSSLTTAAGVDLTIAPYHLELATLNPLDQSVIKDTTDFIFGPYGAYAYLEWRPVRRLLIIPGLRYDYYPELHYAGSMLPEFRDYHFANTTRFSGEPALRTTVRYQLTDDHTLKGSAGTYSQTPQPIGQAIHKDFGNPDLPATKGSQFVAGWEWAITELVNLDVQGYYNRQWDRPRTPVNRELSSALLVGNGKSRMEGLEFFLRHSQSDRFFGWIAYSLARSERYSYGERKWVLYDRDILSNLQVIASWRLPHNMELGFRARYTDGYPMTPVKGIDFYDATNFAYYPLYDEAQSARMAPYVGLDLRFEKKLIYKSLISTWYFEAINLAHILRFVKKTNGEPLYEPPETDSYFYSYNYEFKNAISDIPRATVGWMVDF